MDTNIQTLKSIIANASKILLVAPQYANADSCASIAVLYKILTQRLSKEVDVASSTTIPRRFHDLLQKGGVHPNEILHDVEPISYVITVPEVLTDTVDVQWHKKDVDLNIVLTPEGKEIDFKKIHFSRQGGTYDVVMTVNIAELDELGEIYKKSSKRYQNFEIVTYDFRLRTVQQAKLSLVDREASTTIEVVKKVIEGLEIELDKELSEIIVEGVVASGALQGRSRNALTTLKNTTKLAEKHDISISSISTKYFNSYSKEELRLFERMYRNLSFDETRSVVYSYVTADDFIQTGTNPEHIRGLVQLPYNLTKNLNFAFLLYQVEESFEVILQSNAPSADLKPVLGRLQGYGDRYSGIASLDGTVEDSIKTILNAIAPENKPASPVVPQVQEIKPNQQVAAPQEPKQESKITQEKKADEQKPAVPASRQPVPVPPVPKVIHQKPAQVDSKSSLKAKETNSTEKSELQKQEKPIQEPKVIQPAQKNTHPEPKAKDQKQVDSLSKDLVPTTPQLPNQGTEVQPPTKPVDTKIPSTPQVQTPSMANQPQKPPFEKAPQQYVLDPYATPLKTAPTFSAQNKPFDKAES